MTTTAARHTHNHGTFVADTVEMEVHECGVCHVMFAMSTGFVRNRRKDHASWCCPNGHSWHFSGESEEEKLRSFKDLARHMDTMHPGFAEEKSS